jgi:hypothetical protein
MTKEEIRKQVEYLVKKGLNPATNNRAKIQKKWVPFKRNPFLSYVGAPDWIRTFGEHSTLGSIICSQYDENG